MKIQIMGPPGAGKGTQAKSISMKYSIPHISTGDIFRKNISEGTDLGITAKSYMDKGALVPDEITISMLVDRLGQDDCKNGYLLDGFPRTVAQAVALDNYLKDHNDKLDAVLLLNVPKEFILDRMTGRRSCLSCGASYHIRYNPPMISGKCDICGNDIVQRKDDEEATVKERLDVYDAQTKPLVEYYSKAEILHQFDGTKAINEVFEDICHFLNSTF
ncbi:adenylate kinase [Clostridium sp. 19966]|uniref:adenylate kinase n=1 Tax=Clostridium sp. 19966 TaxID=2768166 RepID=UPI0028DE566F|nr:adenylate kinase [Clostridium sp. 19966]MDT8715836.1 adenylate kinase [Clostridium sp. 19966]